MNNSKKQVVIGVFWSGIQMVVNQSFSFLIRLVLAKLLFPEQFGLVGMATVVTGFVQVINDIGVGAALVQRKDDDLKPIHFYTAFWTGVAWSIILYLIVSFILGPLAATFYNQPILLKLIPVLSIGILASPVNLVHKAQLTKALNFKKITLIDNLSNVVAGCAALVMAFMGGGVWSLAFNSIASIIIAMPLFFKATGWKPKMHWEKQAFKEIFGFGMFTTGTNIINYLIDNVDYLLIGKLVSASALGSYTLAFVLTDTFRSRLMSVINNVMYPVYSKSQGDLGLIKNYYLKVIQYNSLIIYPIMTFFIIFGGELITFAFGDVWHDTLLPLRVLSGAVMVHMLVNSNTVLIRGLGKPQLELKLQVLKSVIFIPMLFVGIYNWGIIGASWAILINKVIAVIIAQYTFNKLLNIKITTNEFIETMKVPLIGSALSGFAGYLLLRININFILGGIAIALIYIGIVILFMRKEIQTTISKFKKPRQEKQWQSI